jgi:hypothetical protein
VARSVSCIPPGELLVPRAVCANHQADTEKRVNDVVTEAKAAADRTRRGAARMAFWMTAYLLFGAFAASLAAIEGGQLRDGTWANGRLVPRHGVDGITKGERTCRSCCGGWEFQFRSSSCWSCLRARTYESRGRLRRFPRNGRSTLRRIRWVLVVACCCGYRDSTSDHHPACALLELIRTSWRCNEGAQVGRL